MPLGLLLPLDLWVQLGFEGLRREALVVIGAALGCSGACAGLGDGGLAVFFLPLPKSFRLEYLRLVQGHPLVTSGFVSLQLIPSR